MIFEKDDKHFLIYYAVSRKEMFISCFLLFIYVNFCFIHFNKRMILVTKTDTLKKIEMKQGEKRISQL